MTDSTSRSRAVCAVPGCPKLGVYQNASGDSRFCKEHGGGRRCSVNGCTTAASGGSTRCIKHRGGKLCAAQNCNKGARGRTDFCIKHGGGVRCSYQGCNRAAQGAVKGRTPLCKAHGGGKRCNASGCQRPVVPRSDKCIAHGGSGLCAMRGCSVQAIQGHLLCEAHGGGLPCDMPGCNSVRSCPGFCAQHAGMAAFVLADSPAKSDIRASSWEKESAKPVAAAAAASAPATDVYHLRRPHQRRLVSYTDMIEVTEADVEEMEADNVWAVPLISRKPDFRKVADLLN